MADRFILSNSYQITQEPLPQYNKAQNRTKSASLSNFTFSGTYVPWDGFENEVRKNFVAQQWGTSIISVRQLHPGPNDLQNEMFLVGDELSLSGRFVQQLLHVMTAVGHDLKIPIRFGDYKTVDPTERNTGQEVLRRQSAGIPIKPASAIDPNEKTISPPTKEPDYVALDDEACARFVGELKTPWTQNFSALSKNDQRWRRHLGE
jgi:hypothetical protein